MANFGRAIWLVFDRIVMALFAIIGLGLLGALAFFGPRWYESLENNRRMVGLANGLIKAELDVPYTPKFKDATVNSRVGENAWLVVGKIVLPGQTGPRHEEPYEAIMHKICPNHSERRCWRLSGLKIGDEVLLAAEVANARSGYEVSLLDVTGQNPVPTETSGLPSTAGETVSVLPSEPSLSAQKDVGQSDAAETANDATASESRLDGSSETIAIDEGSTNLADAGESRPIQVLDQPLGLGVPFPPRKPLSLAQAISQGVPLAESAATVLPAVPTIVAASDPNQVLENIGGAPPATTAGTDAGQILPESGSTLETTPETQSGNEAGEEIVLPVEQEVARSDEAGPSMPPPATIAISLDDEDIMAVEPSVSLMPENLQEVALAGEQSETEKSLEALDEPAGLADVAGEENLAGSEADAAVAEDQPLQEQSAMAEAFPLSASDGEALPANPSSLPRPAPPRPVGLTARHDDTSIDTADDTLARLEPAKRDDARRTSKLPRASEVPVEELPLPQTEPLQSSGTSEFGVSEVDAESVKDRAGQTASVTRGLTQTTAASEETQLESIGLAVETPATAKTLTAPDEALGQTTLVSAPDVSRPEISEPEVEADPASEAVYDTLDTTLAASSKSVEPTVDTPTLDTAESTGSLEDLLAETDTAESVASIEELPLPPRPIMRRLPSPIAEEAGTSPADVAEAETSVGTSDSANVTTSDEERPYVDPRSKQLAGAPPAGNPAGTDLPSSNPLQAQNVTGASQLAPAGDLLAPATAGSMEPAAIPDVASQATASPSGSGADGNQFGEDVSAIAEPAARGQLAARPGQEAIDKAFEEESLLFLIQRRLDRLGFDPGAIRGELTLRTVTAIEDYQRSHDLPVDGNPDFALLQHLESQLRDSEDIAAQDDGRLNKGSSFARDGVAARHRGDNEKAIELFTRAVATGELSDQERAAVFYNRGSAYLDRSLYDQAIFDFNESIKIDSGNGMAFNNRGSAYFQKREYRRAIDDFAQAVKLDRNDAAAYNNRGSAYHKIGEIRSAIADYDTAIRLDPNDATAYSNRGNAFFDQGRYSAAITDYDAAIRLDPNGAAAYNNRGSAYHNQKRYQEAIADYQQTLRLDPDFAVAYNNLANAYFDQDRYGEAIDAYSTAIRLSPKLHGAYFNRARAYERNKELELALIDYKMAYALEPTSEEYKVGLDEFQRRSERRNNRNWMKQLLHTSDEGN